MITAWQPDAFQADAFQIGIGLAEEAGIGLSTVTPAVVVRPPIDFVMEGTYLTPLVFTPLRKTVVSPRVASQDAADLKEMMQLYTQWRMAA